MKERLTLLFILICCFISSISASISCKEIKRLPKLQFVKSIRGGDIVASSTSTSIPALVDYTSAAATFFSQIRLPASIIAGSSLAALFTMNGKEVEKMTRIEMILTRSYEVFAFLSYLLSITAVVISTAAMSSILHGQFNPMAETGYLMLKREFDYEFLLCRFNFQISILLFLIALMNRTLLEFDLLTNKSRMNEAILVICSFLTVITNLISYINTHLHFWDSIPAVGFELLKIIVKKVSGHRGPMAICSVLCFALSILSGMNSMYRCLVK